jgi:hypothetical protein
LDLRFAVFALRDREVRVSGHELGEVCNLFAVEVVGRAANDLKLNRLGL